MNNKMGRAVVLLFVIVCIGLIRGHEFIIPDVEFIDEDRELTKIPEISVASSTGIGIDSTISDGDMSSPSTVRSIPTTVIIGKSSDASLGTSFSVEQIFLSIATTNPIPETTSANSESSTNSPTETIPHKTEGDTSTRTGNETRSPTNQTTYVTQSTNPTDPEEGENLSTDKDRSSTITIDTMQSEGPVTSNSTKSAISTNSESIKNSSFDKTLGTTFSVDQNLLSIATTNPIVETTSANSQSSTSSHTEIIPHKTVGDTSTRTGNETRSSTNQTTYVTQSTNPTDPEEGKYLSTDKNRSSTITIDTMQSQGLVTSNSTKSAISTNSESIKNSSFDTTLGTTFSVDQSLLSIATTSPIVETTSANSQSSTSSPTEIIPHKTEGDTSTRIDNKTRSSTDDMTYVTEITNPTDSKEGDNLSTDKHRSSTITDVSMQSQGITSTSKGKATSYFSSSWTVDEDISSTSTIDKDLLLNSANARTLKLAISVSFLCIALIAVAVLIVYALRVKRHRIQYDEMTLLP